MSKVGLFEKISSESIMDRRFLILCIYDRGLSMRNWIGYRNLKSYIKN